MWPFSKKTAAREPWEEKFAALGPLVLATDQVIGPDRLPVCFAYSREPNNPYDTGWSFLSGKESQKYLDSHPPKVCPLKSFLAMDPSLQDLICFPQGSAWERVDASAPWTEIPGFRPGSRRRR